MDTPEPTDEQVARDFIDRATRAPTAGPHIIRDFEPPTVTPGPPAVYRAIAAVMAEMGPVGKDDRSPEGYQYRGIEGVTRKLQALCGKHGVIIWPQAKISGAEPSPEMKPGWFDWRVEVTWTVAGVDGICLDPAPVTHGIGRDRSDKGINKGMTQAFKYLLLQLFMVSDAKDDPDSHSYEDERRDPSAPREASPYVSTELAAEIAGAIKALTQGQRELVAAEWSAVNPIDGETVLPTVDGKPSVGKLTPAMVPAARALILRAKQAPAADKASDPGSAPDSPQERPDEPAAPEMPAEPSAATQPEEATTAEPNHYPPGTEPF